MCQHSNNTVPKYEWGSYFLIIEVHANKVPMIIEQWPAINNLTHKNKATTNKVCMGQTKKGKGWDIEWGILIPQPSTHAAIQTKNGNSGTWSK